MSVMEEPGCSGGEKSNSAGGSEGAGDVGDWSQQRLLDGSWTPSVGAFALLCQKLTVGCSEGAGDVGDCSPAEAFGGSDSVTNNRLTHQVSASVSCCVVAAMSAPFVDFL
eukprot:CAMPEP_0172666366 /NCGR_PEP_ID=MMETSP1074-20121228/7757_1 /TAXON_ID=2916 /ORGANISM="Ceratium fusus, Strain PA161109" /LENGTH=109 /DNA_ID=CAMNT_0013482739 /DNA_START=637 /DNA_END=964 /DNA_ORIENTATION=-